MTVAFQPIRRFRFAVLRRPVCLRFARSGRNEAGGAAWARLSSVEIREWNERAGAFLLREVECGEGFVEFFCGGVVCAGGVGFVCEVAEVAGFAGGGDLGGPFFLVFVPVDAFVAGGGFCGFFLVAAVLGECGQAEVGSAVVEAVVVDVVDEQVGRGVEYLAVHFDGFSFVLADGVEVAAGAFGEPFVAGEGGVVVCVDEGESAAGERDASRGAAVWRSCAGRVEIRTDAVEPADGPAAFRAFERAADEDGAARAEGEG